MSNFVIGFIHISTENSIFEPFQKCHNWHSLKVKIISLVPFNESVQTVFFKNHIFMEIHDVCENSWFLWKITILMSNHLKNFLKVDSHWLEDFFDLFWLVNLNLTYSAEVDLNKYEIATPFSDWACENATFKLACRTVTCWAKQF